MKTLADLQPDAAPDRKMEYPWAISRATGKVMDAACGPTWLQFLIEQKGLEVYSVDFIKEASLYPDKTERKNFQVHDLSEPLPKKFHDQFDTITIISSIEHMPDDVDIKAIKNLSACLKKGGSIIASFPYGKKGWHTLGNNYELHFTDECIEERLCKPSGLKVTEKTVWTKETLAWPWKDICIVKLTK